MAFDRQRILIAVVLLSSTCVLADDWPQWRGPRRDGVSLETGWLDDWPEGEKPAVAWRAQVGKGHSAASVSRGRLYTMGWDGREETVYCLDALTGEPAWKHASPCATIKQWPGPRSTPAVAGDRVFTLGQHGLLHAFDAASGKVLWKTQLAASYNPDVDYGFAWSPLVLGDLLILGGGTRGLAIRAADGSFAWGDDGKAGACASPVVLEREGRQLVVIVANDGGESVRLVGVDPAQGRELWSSGPWPEKWGAACVDPVVRDGSIFLSTAEQNNECARFSLRGGRLERDWSHRRLPAYTGSCVLVGDSLFGITRSGVLKCLDWATGAERWAQRGFGDHGALIAAADKLVIQCSESGELIIAEASAVGYRELRRFQAFVGEPVTFTAPVVAAGRIYCRSYAGELVCLAAAGAQK
jgi:outer membrane protein assembly factor BamB